MAGLSLSAARLGAEVVAIDWSPAMIEPFEARVGDEGLSNANARGRGMDWQALDFADNSFTGSEFGVMLVPDQPRALGEMVRDTRPGGRVLLIAYRARVPAVLHQHSASRRARLPWPAGRPAAARVSSIGPEYRGQSGAQLSATHTRSSGASETSRSAT